MKEEDWDEFEERLVEGIAASIEKFATEKSEEEVCYVCLDSEPCYGYVLISFNTSEHSLKFVHEWHDENIESCRELISKEIWKNCAYYHIKTKSVHPFCNNAGDFKYQGFSSIYFPEWEEFFNSDEYPENLSHEDDYLESRVALIFWRALQKSADNNVFRKLKIASPLMLGFVFHDQQQVIVRLLNIPRQINA